MRILVLNWRCPRNPNAGGAEFITLEIAKRLVLAGHTVEWFSASFRGAPPAETIDGVRIVRAGRQWTVHWHAFRRYRKTIATDFDIVLDEVNTVPFFTPVWAAVPAVMLIHQLAKEVWWYESRFPLNALGFAIEPLYLQLYRNTPAITVSDSTRRDLEGLGFRGPITVAPIGISQRDLPTQAKAATPTFLYVGRLAPSKRLDDMIEALAQFQRQAGEAELWLVGTGSAQYQASLQRLALRLGVSSNVKFIGRTSEDEKWSLMARAHVLLMTSVREGWGLVVSEANACGTPAVGYNVAGLRDSIRDGVTGLVVSPNPSSLATAMLRLTQDHDLYTTLATAARTWSRSLSLEKCADVVNAVLQGLVGTPETSSHQLL